MVGAHYMSGYKQVAGIMLPTEHRIFARTPEGQVLTEHCWSLSTSARSHSPSPALAVILPGRPATATTELTLPQLDESVGDPSGFPSGSGG